MTKRGHFLVNLGHSEDEPLLSSMQEWDRWGGGGVVDSHQGVGAGQGWVLSHSLFFFFLIFICAFVFWSLMPCLFFK